MQQGPHKEDDRWPYSFHRKKNESQIFRNLINLYLHLNYKFFIYNIKNQRRNNLIFFIDKSFSKVGVR